MTKGWSLSRNESYVKYLTYQNVIVEHTVSVHDHRWSFHVGIEVQKCEFQIRCWIFKILISVVCTNVAQNINKMLQGQPVKNKRA